MADPTVFTNVGNPTTGTTGTVSPLSPGTQYDVDVIASNIAGAATSAIVTATTLSGTAPAPPTGLVASVPTTTSITLTWVPSASGTAPITYQPQFRVIGQSAWNNFGVALGSGGALAGNSAIITGLTSGTTYQFQVVATNAITSATSQIISASTIAVITGPSAPLALTTSSITINSLVLSWAASASGSSPIVYQAQYRVSGQILWTNGGISGQALNTSITGLVSGTNYEFQVIASNNGGSATSSIFPSATLSAGIQPGIPGSFTITAVTPNSATMTWFAPIVGTAPILYQPQYKVSGQTSFATFGIPIPGLTATITGLTPGVTYDFLVVASNAAGSAQSPVQTASTTVSTAAPSAPGTPVPWVITPTSVSLTWIASSSGTATIQYQIQTRVTGQTAWTLFGGLSTATSGTVTGLTPGTNYDFQIVASNSAGASASNILTILAPIVGGTVGTANYAPSQILTAEELDISFDSKLDKTGGPVGPIQIIQTSPGGSQPAMVALSRTAGGVGDSPMISGNYVAIMVDGPVVPYSSIGMTLTLTGDANGNGPAGNVWNILGALSVNALRSSGAPINGSQHAAIVGQLQKVAPGGGIPSGRRLADGWAVYAPVTDFTGLTSSQGGSIAGLYSTLAMNQRDDADLRYGAKIVYGELTPVGSNGTPSEISRGLFLGASSTTAYAKVIVELAGPFSAAAIDLRGANAATATITSATPSGPVTAVSVNKALPFAAAGSPAASINASNPKAVSINGNNYAVVSVSISAGTSGGVLTFASPVSAADAALGNIVIPVTTHTIWLSEGGTGIPAGDLALNRAGTSRIYYDPTGAGTTISAGSDRITALSTASLLLAKGTTAQRPASALFGDLRANLDTFSLETWQPSSSAWVSLQTSASGTGPGPALALVAGSPTTTVASLSWRQPTSGSASFAYQLQYRVAGIAAWTNWGAPQAAIASTISGLTTGTRYDFQVITTNSFGNSTSAMTSVNLSAVAPSAPTGLVPSSPTSTTVALTWTASSSGTIPVTYTPYYRLTGGSTWIQGPIGPTNLTSQTISGLSPATSYDFEVVSSNSGGIGTSSFVTQVTAAASGVAPTAPTSLTAGTPTSFSMIFSWTAPATGTPVFAYQPAYRVTGSGTFIPFAGSIIATSVTITGLAAATSYDFQVTATNSAGSTASGTTTAVTSAAPVASSGTVAGSLTAGPTVPVITGPATATVPPNNVLAIAGVLIIDPPAASAAGSCILTISCTNGTVSSTIAGAEVNGSGGRTISFTNSLSACQVVVAALIYTASPATGSDAIVISLTDQSGSSHLISTAVTIANVVAGGGGAVPTDGSGPVAVQAQGLLNKFGVNIHIDFAGYQTAGLAMVENCVNYLGGIKLLRDAAGSSSDSTWWAQVAQTTGAQFISAVGMTSSSAFGTYLSNVTGIPTANIAALEGCQEADSGQVLGFAETLQQAAAFQPTVFAAGQSAGLPVIQMSFGQGFDINPSQGNYGAVGNLSAYATYGNAHVYCATSPQSQGTLTSFITLSGLATPNKAAAITQFGWNQVVGAGNGHCSPATAAAYILMMIVDAYRLGCPYYIWDALIDDLASESSVSRGLFTDAGAPRLTATAIRNFFGLLSDSGSNALTFTPGKLNYSLTSLPSNTGTTGGYQLLLQKSDGSFWLALWNEQPLNNTSTGADLTVAPVSITLTIGETVASIAVYDPSVSAVAVQTATSVTGATISLPARVILVKVVK
jgi:hypothetical protein